MKENKLKIKHTKNIYELMSKEMYYLGEVITDYNDNDVASKEMMYNAIMDVFPHMDELNSQGLETLRIISKDLEDDDTIGID